MIELQNNRDFLGTWALVSYHIFDANEVLQPVDTRIEGRLIYCSNGTMSVVITRGPEGTTNLSDVIAYSGKYIIEGAQIKHIIEVSSISSFYGSVQLRDFKFSHDTLELSTTGRLDGRHVLLWRKLGS